MLSSIDDIISICEAGDPMPDPYEQFGQFRTFDLPPPTSAQTWAYNNRTGCDQACYDDQYVLYNCYINSGAFYSSCDTKHNPFAQSGYSCRGTYNTCLPDKATQLQQFTYPVSGLTPVDIKRRDWNPGYRGLTYPDSTGNHININYTRFYTIYARNSNPWFVAVPDPSMPVTSLFPKWTLKRLGYGIEASDCTPGLYFLDVGDGQPGCYPCTPGKYQDQLS